MVSSGRTSIQQVLVLSLSLEWLKAMASTCLPESSVARNTSWHLAKVTYYLWMTLGGAPLLVVEEIQKDTLNV